MDDLTRATGQSYDYAYWVNGESIPTTPLAVVDLVRQRLDRSDSVLYVGYGNGRNADGLLNDQYDLFACDVSAVAIENGQSRHSPDVTHRLAHDDFRDAFHGKKFAAAVVSRCLVDESLQRSIDNFRSLRQRLIDDGALYFQLPAIGTDLWPGWTNHSLEETGSLIVEYGEFPNRKLYLSFQGICTMLESAGFDITWGPNPVETARSKHPGGVVRNWLGQATASV